MELKPTLRICGKMEIFRFTKDFSLRNAVDQECWNTLLGKPLIEHKFTRPSAHLLYPFVWSVVVHSNNFLESHFSMRTATFRVLCKQHATGINCNRAKSKYFNMQWMFIVQWYQLKAAAGTRLKESCEFNSMENIFLFLQILYLGGARSNSLPPCFFLKSLKTRLNVFLNVFREGDWRSRLSSGMERGFYRSIFILAGSDVL